MIKNIETGKFSKEQPHRSYACCGCENYYDDSDFICKSGCKYYAREL